MQRVWKRLKFTVPNKKIFADIFKLPKNPHHFTSTIDTVFVRGS